MNPMSAIITRIQEPRTHSRLLFISGILTVSATLITFLAVQNLNAVLLTLFLVVAQPCIIVGVSLFLIVVIADFFRHHGVARAHFEPGQIIFRQGDSGDFIYTIIEGQVEIVKEERNGQERVIDRMGAGEYFGEMALVSDAPRTATVRALTPLDVLTLARADFTALYAYLPDLQQSIGKVMQQRGAAIPVERRQL